jgi:hypothetical protein
MRSKEHAERYDFPPYSVKIVLTRETECGDRSSCTHHVCQIVLKFAKNGNLDDVMLKCRLLVVTDTTKVWFVP